MKINFYKTQRGSREWLPLISMLKRKGYSVYDGYTPDNPDLNVILSGQFENPNNFKGPTLLVWHSDEWADTEYLFRTIVPYYYDHMVDVTTTKTVGECLQLIEDKIAEIRETCKSRDQN